jgi:hypothetical protein
MDAKIAAVTIVMAEVFSLFAGFLGYATLSDSPGLYLDYDCDRCNWINLQFTIVENKTIWQTDQKLPGVFCSSSM